MPTYSGSPRTPGSILPPSSVCTGHLEGLSAPMPTWTLAGHPAGPAHRVSSSEFSAPPTPPSPNDPRGNISQGRGSGSGLRRVHRGWIACREFKNKHKTDWKGLPWWCSGWESACQCRGHGFEPWSGKIPHAAEQLGPWATTTDPARLELVLRNKRGRDSERPAHRDEEWPPLAATRESPRTETKTQHSQK